MSKRTIIIGVILLGTIFLSGIVWYQTALRFRSRNIDTVDFRISAGTSTAQIVQELKNKKLISSPLAVKLYLSRHKDIKIQAGEYQFPANTPTRQLISNLATGKSLSREVSILFREGLTSKDMQAELIKRNYLMDNSFYTLAQTPLNKLPDNLQNFSFIKLLPSTVNLEGYLFPDTYRVYKEFSAEELIEKMLQNFEFKLTDDLRIDIIKSGHSLNDIITMASLLEREVRTEEDMKIVSGLFWDRITVGQALQSCASLAYILGVNKAQYSYEDTQIDSPYNTYQHRDLPPGPIGNPGLRAIKAALYPTKTDYNYFLSRPDTGETVFSVTLEEHNEAKAKYLK
jgi:UPF0755 protein